MRRSCAPPPWGAVRENDVVPSLTAEELSAAVDPSAVLRRVIRHDRGFFGLPLQVPHRKTYLVAADTLLRLSTPEEPASWLCQLGIDPGRQLTGTVILLVRPELRDEPREKLLLECWRLLFHAQVHRFLEECRARGDLSLKGRPGRGLTGTGGATRGCGLPRTGSEVEAVAGAGGFRRKGVRRVIPRIRVGQFAASDVRGAEVLMGNRERGPAGGADERGHGAPCRRPLPLSGASQGPPVWLTPMNVEGVLARARRRS